MFALRRPCPVLFPHDTPTQIPPSARGFRALLTLGLVAVLPASLHAAFGLTNSGGYYTVDTGAGLVFRINQGNGDLSSLEYRVCIDHHETLRARRPGIPFGAASCPRLPVSTTHTFGAAPASCVE